MKQSDVVMQLAKSCDDGATRATARYFFEEVSIELGLIRTNHVFWDVVSALSNSHPNASIAASADGSA